MAKLGIVDVGDLRQTSYGFVFVIGGPISSSAGVAVTIVSACDGGLRVFDADIAYVASKPIVRRARESA